MCLYTQPCGHHKVLVISHMNMCIWDSRVKCIYSGNHKLNSTGAQTLLPCKDSSYAEGRCTIFIFLYAMLLASCILPSALWCGLVPRLYVMTIDNLGSAASDNMEKFYEAVLQFTVHIPPTSCAYYRCLHLALYIEKWLTFQMPLGVHQGFSSSLV